MSATINTLNGANIVLWALLNILDALDNGPPGMTGTTKEHAPPKEKGRLGGRPDLEANQRQTHLAHETDRRKWKHSLERALDAESGDLGLIERNLVESATEMLSVAAEIRRGLRQ